MPVREDYAVPPIRENSKQLGVNKSLLYNGSKFKGYQKSKGNSYEVEVILQVRLIDLTKISNQNKKLGYKFQRESESSKMKQMVYKNALH